MINILDDALINKIAAGEVIERPAAVVKELIENSVDAGADSITVTIGEGGKSLIRVEDNGHGMTKEDAILSIQRHATSKIQKVEDLFNISSLGFRGEALASIAAVSRTRIITKTKKDVAGTEITVEGSKVMSVKEMGCNTGTVIEVASLFYNTPARKKYMKSMRQEQNVIIDIVTRYALACRDISFVLFHDRKRIINSPKSDDMGKIVSIYGPEAGRNLMRISSDESNFSVKGYISKPSFTRGDKSQQSIYVNGRYVRNRAITDALYEGYHSTLFTQRHPIAVIFVDIDPSLVDVNVHPTKDIIRIENEQEVYDAVKNAVRDALQKSNLAPDVSLDSYSNIKSTRKYPFAKDRQSMLVKENRILGEVRQEPKIEAVTKERLGAYRILGQLNRTYIVSETPEGLMIIDQHAAEERVNYEQLMQEFQDRGIKTQKLVKPKVIELTAAESRVVLDNIKVLEKTGFMIEPYGQNSIIVRAIPAIFGRYYDDLLIDLINEMKKVRTIKEDRIIRFACRKSVKAGEEMSRQEMEQLLEMLDSAEQPFSCPHGRPTIIRLSIGELEKKFKRV